MLEDKRRKRRLFSVVEGVFTAKQIEPVVRLAIEKEHIRAVIIETLVGVQRGWKVRCPECRTCRSVTVLTKRALDGLCRGVIDTGDGGLLERIQRRYSTLTLKCPACGLCGGLDPAACYRRPRSPRSGSSARPA